MIKLLYLIKHKFKPIFKIGIATDYCRFKSLNSDYFIDWESSLYFEGKYDDVVRFEKILHRGFYKFNEPQSGTGGTEWFHNSCLYNVVETIIELIPRLGFDIDLNFQNIKMKSKKIKLVGKNKTYCIPTISNLGLVYNFYNIDNKERNKITKLLRSIENNDVSDSILTSIKNNEYEDLGITTNGGNPLIYYCEYTGIGLYTSLNNIIGLNSKKRFINNTEFVIENIFKKIKAKSFRIENIDLKLLKIKKEDIPSKYNHNIYYKHHWNEDFDIITIYKK